MKRILGLFSLFIVLFIFVSCGAVNETSVISNSESSEIISSSSISDTSSSSSVSSTSEVSINSSTSISSISSSISSTTSSSSSSSSKVSVSSMNTSDMVSNATPTIYLAGDSTVKTYADSQYIAGWGQYLSYFLDSSVTVRNMSEGGRSSRSFINEGRLFDITGNTCGYTSIGSTINAGDYLFIQFGHNDDDTKSGSTKAERMVPLGTPNASGVYPVTAGEKTSTSDLSSFTLGTDYESSFATAVTKYGDTYYSYYSGGTYKWFLKQYIDFARSKGAIPVLVTPVARLKLDADNVLQSGAGLHGENFSYVTAVRQLASEEDCLLVDLFADSKNLFETATNKFANYLMALKPNSYTGTWPTGYDNQYATAADGIEATHYNKFGSFLLAGFVAEHLITYSSSKKLVYGTEYIDFGDYLKTIPSSYIVPSTLMTRASIKSLTYLFDTVTVIDPDSITVTPAQVITAINGLSSLTISSETYEDCRIAIAAVRELYDSLNVEDKPSVSNYSALTTAEASLAAAKPVYETMIFDPSDLTVGAHTADFGTTDYTILATTDKAVTIEAKNNSFTVDGTSVSVSADVKLGGGYGTNYRKISFTTKSACTIYVACASGSTTTSRDMTLLDSTNTIVEQKSATALTVLEFTVDAGGTYSLGSASSSMTIYYIMVQYK